MSAQTDIASSQFQKMTGVCKMLRAPELAADQADRVINVLAAGSKYSAAEIGELSQSFNPHCSH